MSIVSKVVGARTGHKCKRPLRNCNLGLCSDLDAHGCVCTAHVRLYNKKAKSTFSRDVHSQKDVRTKVADMHYHIHNNEHQEEDTDSLKRCASPSRFDVSDPVASYVADLLTVDSDSGEDSFFVLLPDLCFAMPLQQNQSLSRSFTHIWRHNVKFSDCSLCLWSCQCDNERHAIISHHGHRASTSTTASSSLIQLVDSHPECIHIQAAKLIYTRLQDDFHDGDDSDADGDDSDADGDDGQHDSDNGDDDDEKVKVFIWRRNLLASVEVAKFQRVFCSWRNDKWFCGECSSANCQHIKIP